MTERTVLGVVDGGPCETPYTVVSGDSKNVINCGKHEPANRQCDACRITIIETVTGIRYHGPNFLFIDQDGWLCELIKGDTNV